jgi:profilin
MSWEQHAQEFIRHGFLGGSIVGINEPTVWGSCNGFPLTPKDIQTMISAFNNPEAMYSSGLIVDNDKYIVIKANENEICGKISSGGNKNGICCVKTNQTILICKHDESMNSNQALSNLGKIADYLRQCGY